MKRALPTVALTRSRVPPPGGRDASAYFRVFDGYAEAGDHETMVEIMHRAKDEGLGALSVHELRIEHFRTQRAQRHGGGPYGPDDVYDRHMGAIRAEIRERLTALGPTIGVWSGDITRLEVDAIVTAANRSLSGGGGVDGAIHRAAGPALLEACLQLPEVSPGVRCPVGEARITPGFRLGTEHVIHAVGPVWDGGTGDERCLLASAYRESLVLAVGVGAQSVAVPAISTGAFGFPVTEAARIAVDTARAFQRERKGPERIVLVAFDDETEQSLREALGPDRLV